MMAQNKNMASANTNAKKKKGLCKVMPSVHQPR
jgi:hypothetical protein